VPEVNPSDPLRVIVNPAASGGAGAGVREEVEAGLAARNIPFSLAETNAPGHARTLAREAALEGAARLLVVGGDGTVHEVANGFLDDDLSPPAMAVVPVGTGNDFFRMVGSLTSVIDALALLEDGVPQEFDVGRVRFDGGSSFFVNLLGIGVDVEVLLHRERFRRLRGLPQYLAALASALVRFRPESYQVSIWNGDDQDASEIIETRTLLTTVTVGPSIGGGFLVSPEASPADGLLDLFFVESIGPLKIARYVPRVIRGTHQGIPELRMGRLTGATIRRSDGSPFHFELDGERMAEPTTGLEVQVCPGRLRVLCPGTRP
jgi:YegS/Rv2252/BmrU family lipid kinase